MEAAAVHEVFHVHLCSIHAEADGSGFVEIVLGGYFVFSYEHFVVVEVERDLVRDAVIFLVRCPERILTLNRWESAALADELNVILAVLHVAPAGGKTIKTSDCGETNRLTLSHSAFPSSQSWGKSRGRVEPQAIS